MSDEIDLPQTHKGGALLEMKSPRRAIVNVAFGVRKETNVAYSTAQQRLVRSIKKAGRFGGSVLTWCEHEPDGAASHDTVQYHFKGVALHEAATRGHESLLWLDAVMVVVKHVEEMWQKIEEQGYV
jgi:hypothetical protein